MSLLLFEFEDQSWFPPFLRAYQTDFLGFITKTLGIYQPVGTLLEVLCSDAVRVVDLASGSGIPAISITERLRAGGTKLILTDKFPNPQLALQSVKQDGVSFEKCIDILQYQWPEAEIYTLINAFHHFSPDEQRDIAKYTHDTRKTLVVIEPLSRNARVFLKVLIVTTLGVLISVPFMRPFSWKRIFLTYIFPVGILVLLWDGLVSVLRAPTDQKIRKLIDRTVSSGVHIKHGMLRGKFARLTYLIVK